MTRAPVRSAWRPRKRICVHLLVATKPGGEGGFPSAVSSVLESEGAPASGTALISGFNLWFCPSSPRLPELSSVTKVNSPSHWLAGLDLAAHRTAVDRFLQILGFIHHCNPQNFQRVLDLTGDQRTYFARSAEGIASTGSHTQPKLIPGSPFWVVTNNDTPKKQRIVDDVLRLLEYPDADRRIVVALVDPKYSVMPKTLNAFSHDKRSAGDGLI